MGTFADLTKLTELYLSQNALKIFDFEWISSMRSTLQQLDITINQLNELKISTNLSFTALVELNITGNKFDCSLLQRFFNLNEGKALANRLVKSSFVIESNGVYVITCENMESLLMYLTIAAIFLSVFFGIMTIIYCVLYTKAKGMPLREVNPYPTLAEILQKDGIDLNQYLDTIKT